MYFCDKGYVESQITPDHYRRNNRNRVILTHRCLAFNQPDFSFFCFCLYLYDHSFGYYADKENGQDGPPAGKLLQRNNNDFNAHFTEKGDDKFLNGLFREMNRIITQFENNHTELEERRFYYESIIRVLTHEIRNSITPIASLSTDLIKYNDEYGKEGTIDGLQTINQQVQQLNTFLNAYHRLTPLPDPVKAKVQISSLFDKLERLLSSEQGSENIRYISPENIEILLDQNLITLALINLIRNALQATANNPEPQIRVESGKEVTFSFIQVTDNGKGIPENRLEDVFTPFYSTKKEGSGIGLPLSRRIMQLHGGELIVNSEPGEGTVFRMTFPSF